jgi:hypothetical protein
MLGIVQNGQDNGDFPCDSIRLTNLHGYSDDTFIPALICAKTLRSICIYFVDRDFGASLGGSGQSRVFCLKIKSSLHTHLRYNFNFKHDGPSIMSFGQLWILYLLSKNLVPTFPRCCAMVPPKMRRSMGPTNQRHPHRP